MTILCYDFFWWMFCWNMWSWQKIEVRCFLRYECFIGHIRYWHKINTCQVFAIVKSFLFILQEIVFALNLFHHELGFQLFIYLFIYFYAFRMGYPHNVVKQDFHLLCFSNLNLFQHPFYLYLKLWFKISSNLLIHELDYTTSCWI